MSENLLKNRIYAVDFDGTLCRNAYPDIGEPRQEIIDFVLREQKEFGAKLILWTNRTDKQLDEAVRWCNERGIIFDAINHNIPEVIETFGGDTRKVFAHYYLDDRSIMLDSIVQYMRM